MPAEAPWNERTLADGECLRADFGDLTLVVHSVLEEWRVAVVDPSRRDELDDPDHLPDDLPWERWDRGPKDTRISFRPVFPDRPVIVRPRAPLHLSPKAKALFYIGLPSWIELRAEVEGDWRVLSAWPTVRLSNTWHGDPTNGILCYAAKTRARRQFVTGEWDDYDIATTVEISNQTDNTLPFERLLLETDHLAIFLHQGRLWSNHARIRAAKNDSELSGVVFSPRPYDEAADATEISPARMGIVRRSGIRAAFASVLGTLQDD
jgi:hypothetical protein